MHIMEIKTIECDESIIQHGNVIKMNVLSVPIYFLC
jgi:hypothetical protein